MASSLAQMMKRAGRAAVAVIGAGLILAVLGGCEKRAETRKYVVGYIDPNPEEKEGAPGFLRNMPKFGFIEGKNVTYIRVETKNKQAIEDAIREMVAERVDLIMTMSTPVTKMAKELTKEANIPVVFIMYDAIGSGVVKGLVDHDRNITGVQLQGSTPKALEWLTAMKAGAKRIFVPVAFDTGAARKSLAKLQESCDRVGFKLTVAEIKNAAELRSALSSMPESTDAVFMVHSWLVGTHAEEVIAEATRRHIPVISAGHVDYQHGLVMSYGPTDESAGAQAARLAHKILEGTSPGYLPVENAEVFLGINLRSAREAGVEIPETMLRRADFIVR